MMRKIFFLVLFIIFIGSIHSYSQEKNVVYINVIPILVSNLNLHYEFALSNKITLLAGVGYMSGLFGQTIEDFEITTTALKIGFGFYPAGQPLRGFYILPNFIQNNMSVKYKPTSATGSVSWQIISVEFGHRWIWKGGVMFDLSIGMGSIPEVEAKAGDHTEKIAGRTGLTHLGVQFGYAW